MLIKHLLRSNYTALIGEYFNSVIPHGQIYFPIVGEYFIITEVGDDNIFPTETKHNLVLKAESLNYINIDGHKAAEKKFYSLERFKTKIFFGKACLDLTVNCHIAHVNCSQLNQRIILYIGIKEQE